MTMKKFLPLKKLRIYYDACNWRVCGYNLKAKRLSIRRTDSYIFWYNAAWVPGNGVNSPDRQMAPVYWTSIYAIVVESWRQKCFLSFLVFRGPQPYLFKYNTFLWVWVPENWAISSDCPMEMVYWKNIYAVIMVPLLYIICLVTLWMQR